MSSKVELNFDIIQEPWNLYEIEDGIIIKVRVIVKRVFRFKETEEKGGYDVEQQNITVIAHIPPELKGKKSQRKLTTQEAMSAVIRDDVRFSVLREEWNEYAVEDGAKIRLKVSLMNVGKTNQFDQNGDPIYTIQTSAMASIKPPKKYSDFEKPAK
jgi:hypothetical protein